jgi:hypothetical protein
MTDRTPPLKRVTLIWASTPSPSPRRSFPEYSLRSISLVSAPLAQLEPARRQLTETSLFGWNERVHPRHFGDAPTSRFHQVPPRLHDLCDRLLPHFLPRRLPVVWAIRRFSLA